MIEWLKGRAARRRADLDRRVLAEVRRLGSAHDLEIRRVVRAQHAVLRLSLARLEEAGELRSRNERPPGATTGARQVWFVNPDRRP